MPMIRCFVAVAVPPAVASAAASIQDCLRRAGVRARWVAESNVHLTLRFLGEQPQDRIPELASAMAEAASTAAPFELTTEALGVFPARGAPRVLWLGLSGALEPLGRLQRSLDDVLADRCGIAREGRPFHGHLTLARFRERPRQDPIRSALADCRSAAGQTFRVDRLCLFESRLEPGGARYRLLSAAGLGA